MAIRWRSMNPLDFILPVEPSGKSIVELMGVEAYAEARGVEVSIVRDTLLRVHNQPPLSDFLEPVAAIGEPQENLNGEGNEGQSVAAIEERGGSLNQEGHQESVVAIDDRKESQEKEVNQESVGSIEEIEENPNQESVGAIEEGQENPNQEDNEESVTAIDERRESREKEGNRQSVGAIEEREGNLNKEGAQESVVAIDERKGNVNGEDNGKPVGAIEEHKTELLNLDWIDLVDKAIQEYRRKKMKNNPLGQSEKKNTGEEQKEE